MPLLERDLAGPVAAHIESLGYRVWAEVDIAGRWADLVGIGPDVVAVELKLHAWRDALRQATAYQLGADRVYVAMPLARVQDVWGRRHAFEREGIGLLAVDTGRSVRDALPARPSPRLFPPIRAGLQKRLIDSLETVNMVAWNPENAEPETGNMVV